MSRESWGLCEGAGAVGEAATGRITLEELGCFGFMATFFIGVFALLVLEEEAEEIFTAAANASFEGFDSISESEPC